MDCPACGLTNPPRAQRCDCGFPLADASPRAIESARAVQRNRLKRTIIGGAITVMCTIPLALVGGWLLLGATAAGASAMGYGIVGLRNLRDAERGGLPPAKITTKKGS